MSERPTPETDAAERMAFAQEYMVPTAFARKLERERDQAREAAAKWESSFDAMERAGAEQARRADENREWALRAERERDEAREALADWENAADHVEANHPDEVHCGCVPVLRKLLADARKERDEALAAIVGWENKWKCAVYMAAQAEVERDEARNKMADALQEVDLRTLDYERMKQERDQAREKLSRVLKLLDDYDQAIKNPSSPFWDAFKKWFTYEAAK